MAKLIYLRGFSCVLWIPVNRTPASMVNLLRAVMNFHFAMCVWWTEELNIPCVLNNSKNERQNERQTKRDPTNPLANQPTYQPTNQPADAPTHQPTNLGVRIVLIATFLHIAKPGFDFFKVEAKKETVK